MADFVAAFGNLVPSLTIADLDRYDKLEQQYAPERQRAKGLGGAASSSSGAASSSAATPEMLAAAMAAASSGGGDASLKLRPKLPPRRKSSAPSTPSHAVDGL